jgi:hypothetical protein
MMDRPVSAYLAHRYFIFELIIRTCVELRLTVPYAFVAIEIPSRFFLMIGDLLLLGALWQNSEIIRKRLSIKNDALTYLSKPFAMIGMVGISVIFFGERIAYIVMMVKQGFRWGRPDPMYYAISRTIYTGSYLLLALLLWIRFLRQWIVYRKRVSSGTYSNRCQKVSLLSAIYTTGQATDRSVHRSRSFSSLESDQ